MDQEKYRPDVQYREPLLKQAGAVLNMFEGNSRHSWLEDYRATLSRCAQTYGQLEQLRDRYRKQSLILESYLQKDKLRDYMEMTAAFGMAQPRPTDTAEKLAVKGYSNHLFVIRCTLADLECKLAAFTPTQEDPTHTVRRFLSCESSGQPVLEQWQQLRSRISLTFKSTGVTAADYSRLISELDELEIRLKTHRKEIIAFLNEKNDILLARMARMEQEITLGEALYPALTALFTQELFDRFDPDTNPELEQDITLVREMYRALSLELTQLLADYPRR